MRAPARAWIALLAAPLLGAAAEPPPPPAEIAAYIVDGRFEPRDYGWARGAFPEATPEQKAVFDAATGWAAQCRQVQRDEAVAELAAMGIDAPGLPDNLFAFGKCPVLLPDRKSTRLNSSHVEISYAV